MEYVNIHIPGQIRSPGFVGSSPAERGTWLCVLAYAMQIECGGRIVGARLWKARQWPQACMVTIGEVRSANKLLRFDGDDLIVEGYPDETERKVQLKRSGGASVSDRKSAASRVNGSKGGRPITQQEPYQEPKDNPTEEPKDNPTEPNKEREGKEIERKGSGSESAHDPTQPTQSDLDVFNADHPEVFWVKKPPPARTFETCEQEWKFKVMHEPFGQALIAANVKFVERDWSKWKGVIHRLFAGDVAACMAVAVTIPADVRYPDRVETAISKTKPDLKTIAADAAASKYGRKST